MNGFAEGAGTFAVDDADLPAPLLSALGQVFLQKAGNILWAESVQIQFPRDWYSDWLWAFVVRHGETLGWPD